MVSVVMATYNGEKFVRTQIESILKQSRKPDEIIVNDDNSIDDTVAIIEAIKRTSEIPICIQINKVRVGYAQNFRHAICRASGDIVFLSDQDDVWLENKIERCMSVFERQKEVLALSTGYYLTDAKLSRRQVPDTLKEGQLIKVSWRKFIRHPKYPGMAMAFKKEIWPDIDAMDWKPRAAHDWMINQYAASQDGMYMLGDRLVFYRQHGGNAAGVIINERSENIRNNRLKQIDEQIDALETICPETLEKANYAKKMILFQMSRKEILKVGKLFWLLVYELCKIKYISIRSILGDVYVCIKSGKERYV